MNKFDMFHIRALRNIQTCVTKTNKRSCAKHTLSRIIKLQEHSCTDTLMIIAKAIETCW